MSPPTETTERHAEFTYLSGRQVSASLSMKDPGPDMSGQGDASLQIHLITFDLPVGVLTDRNDRNEFITETIFPPTKKLPVFLLLIHDGLLPNAKVRSFRIALFSLMKSCILKSFIFICMFFSQFTFLCRRFADLLYQ